MSPATRITSPIRAMIPAKPAGSDGFMLDSYCHFDTLTPRAVGAKRDLLAVSDLSRAEVTELLGAAVELKRGKDGGRPLAGKSIGLLFSKSSTRTRVSFEVGAFQLGAHASFLSLRDIQLGRGEPMRDTARVLSR